VERFVTTPTAATIDTANPEQAAAWNGHEGGHWATHADRFERIGSTIWQRLLDRDLIGHADRVLDVGCGTGRSTRDLGRIAVDGNVLGVDLSAPMLAVARARARADGLTNVDFVQADAQIHPFEHGRSDVVVSCFGAMFFADPVAAFTNLASGLRPDGTLALLAWRQLDRNEWIAAIRAALAMGRDLPVPPPEAPTPFSLADPARVRSLLGSAGFDAIDLEAIDEGMVFGTDADDAYGFLQTMSIVEWLTHDLDPSSRTEALARLRAVVEAHEQPGSVAFSSSAWLITARRRSSAR
jgi:SAM-dependent methyltransferase